MDGSDGVFGRESPHHQCQLRVGRRLKGSTINSLYVFGPPKAAAVHFHYKLDKLHDFLLTLWRYCFLPIGRFVIQCIGRHLWFRAGRRSLTAHRFSGSHLQ